MPGLPAGPFKPYNAHRVGEQVQKNYEFMEELFGRDNAAYRQRLLGMTDAELRAELEEYGLEIPEDVRIVLVDLETATLHCNGPKIDPQKDTFYQLVMPPVPRRHIDSEQYMNDQQWEDAWYHAIVDGYGM